LPLINRSSPGKLVAKPSGPEYRHRRDVAEERRAIKLGWAALDGVSASAGPDQRPRTCGGDCLRLRPALPNGWGGDPRRVRCQPRHPSAVRYSARPDFRDRLRLSGRRRSRSLRCDAAFKLACGRLPDSGSDLCSQPTVSRWENALSLRDLIRLMRGDGRSVLRQLPRATSGGDAGH
jgi:hypothetical protein